MLDSNASPSVPQAASLRALLRRGTDPAHRRLDSSIAHADVARSDGLGVFLALQYAGWSGLDGAVPDDGPVAGLIRRTVADAAEDLAALGQPLPEVPPLPEQPCALAVEYVFLGGRLGTRMLARHWASSSDPAVRAACKLMGRQDRDDLWARFKARTDTGAYDAAQSARIVGDACAIFDRFITIRETLDLGTGQRN